MTEGEDLLLQLRATSAPASRDTSFASQDERDPLPRRRITPEDDEWPEKLDHLHESDRPNVLYLEGRRLDSAGPSVAVVGTRRPTAAGVEAAETLTAGLVEGGITVISGLAVGIDTVAHRTALRRRGYTIGVLGCGLDVDYPSRNRGVRKQIGKAGTLVSEFEDGVQPLAHHFPLRNRIVAAMATGVLVVEGGARSGALITARLGLDLGRHIWAVPGSTRNAMAEGPNRLIRTGQAKLVTSIEHIFDDLATQMVWENPRDVPPMAIESLTDQERTVLCVLDDVSVSPDRVISLTGLAPGEVALALSRLEVRGYVLRRGAGYEISGGGGRIRAALLEGADEAASGPESM